MIGHAIKRQLTRIFLFAHLLGLALCLGPSSRM
jgi:hypothetical protein